MANESEHCLSVQKKYILYQTRIGLRGYFILYTLKNMYKICPAPEQRHTISWFTISVFVSGILYIKTHPEVTEVKIFRAARQPCKRTV
uniref:Uncharacterized protein n=1 Tax=Anguilla anguilla TaxID=7936 RepID=A0A0E9XII0_ANGAN